MLSNLPAKKSFKLISTLLCYLLLFSFIPLVAPGASGAAAETYQFVKMWPELAQPWYFSAPESVAVDSSGNVYVADSGNNRIQKFTSSGIFITKWGSKGSGDGQFSWPSGIAVDSSDNVYVVDTYNYRIQKFTSGGTFVAKWGSGGTGDGQFWEASGIAFDSSDNVYVADAHNHRIQKFTSGGTLITKWGSEGAGDGDFYSPRGIAVDSSGTVYVADTGNDRFQKFTSSGAFVGKWGSSGSGDGELSNPRGIVVDASDKVYIADSGNNRIQKFTSSGAFVTKWGSYGTGDGQFDEVADVAVDSSGNVFVADGNNSIQKFTSSGAFSAKWSSRGAGDSELASPQSIAVDSSGTVYVADTGNDRLQKFTSSGTFIAKWGSSGSGDGEFDWPRAVAIDPSGNVYVADTGNNRIQKFTSSGTFIAKWGSSGSGDGQFWSPNGIAVDSSGNVYVSDPDNYRIQKFTASGVFIAKWEGSGSGDGQFDRPGGIAVDTSGNVYVADTENHRIQKFDSSGAFIAKWGSSGSGDVQFDRPGGIAVDSSGNVYVADSNNHRIQKFNSSGAFVTKWGSSGSEEGEFNRPGGVAVDASGNVYVADTGNNRIQEFAPGSSEPNTTLATNPSPPNGDNDWFKTNPTITLTPDETATTYYAWDGGSDITYTAPLVNGVPSEGTHTLEYYSIDTANNTETTMSRQFKYDGTLPSDPNATNSPSHTIDATSTNRTVEIEFSGASDAVSGVEGYSVSWTHDSSVPDESIDITQTTDNTQTVSSPTLADGAWWFNLRTKDFAGNWTSTLNIGPFIIDGDPFTVLSLPDPDEETGWYQAAPVIALTPNETAAVYYQWDSTTPGTFVGDSSFDASVGLSAPEGQHTLYYFSVDSAGNTETIKNSGVLKIDTQKPTGSASINSGAASTNNTAVTLNLSANDPAPASGLDKMQFSNDGASWSSLETYATTKTWTLPAGDGNKTVYVRFSDKAGNISNAYQDSITLSTTVPDTAAPAASVTSPKLSTTVSKNTTFKVSWSGTDPSPSSGIAAYDIQAKVGRGGAWTNWRTNTNALSANYKAKAGQTIYFRARAKDGAGNTGAWSPESKTIVPFDNNSLISSKVGFGSTFSKASSNFYMGTARYSKTKGDTITYKFTGDYVALISTKGKDYSKAKIFIDGKFKKTVDAKASTTKYRQAIYGAALKNGKHTIKIENLGTAGRTRFDVDGLGIGR